MASRKRARAKRPKTSHTDHDHEQTLYPALTLCFVNAKLKQETELNTLARLACSSKQLRASVQQYVQTNVGPMLSTVAGQAHNAQKAAQEFRRGPGVASKEQELARTLAQAKWICVMSGVDALTQQMQELLRVRRVPKEVTQMVLSTGVQLTTAHLVDAAIARVEGLDTWVLEPYCSQLPPLVRALFGSHPEQFKQLLPSLGSPCTPPLVDLLHLAINDSRSAVTAEALLQFLQGQHASLEQKQQELQQQGANACHPQRRMVTRRKTRSEQQQQSLRDQITQLKELIIEVDNRLSCPRLVEQLLATAVARRHDKVVTMLCHLPTVQYLSGAAVLRLLHRCIVHKVPCKPILEQLLALAEGIGAAATSAEEASLLKADGPAQTGPAAAAAGTSQQLQLQPWLQGMGQTAGGRTCPLGSAETGSRATATAAAAAAAQIEPDKEPMQQQLQQQPVLAGVTEFTELLVAAVQRSNGDAVRLLVRQPVAQVVDSQTAIELARFAVELRADGLLNSLKELPAVQELPAAEIQQLLGVAVLQGTAGFQLVRSLCSLQQAAAITAADMASLLHAAVQQGSRMLMEQLSSAPAVQSVTGDMAVQLLEAAIAGLPGTEASLLVLCESSPAATVSPTVLAQLIKSALQHPCCTLPVMTSLCQLAPAQLMSSSAVADVLNSAFESNHTGSLISLCLLPGAQQLSGSNLYQLLRNVLFLNRPTAHSMVTQLLFYLMAPAQHLQVWQIYDVMQDIFQSGSSSSSLNSALKGLAVLPAAQELAPTQAATLVRAALRLPKASDAVKVLLLELQPARLMPSDTITSLVLSAFVLEVSSPIKMDAAAQLLGAAAQLLQLPSATGLDASSIASLLQALFDALRNTSDGSQAEHVVQLLCSQPGVQEITPVQFEGLVRALFRLHGRFSAANALALTWLALLVAFPAAQQLGAAAVEGLIWTAILKTWALKQLLTALDVASVLDAAAVERLLLHALSPGVYITSGLHSYAGLQFNITSPISQLVKLPGFQQLAPAAITRLIHSAIQQCRSDALKYLCQLDGPAAAVDKATLLELLRVAVMRMTGKGVTYVCRLLAPHGLSRAEVDALLKLNEEMGHAFDRSLGLLLLGMLH